MEKGGYNVREIINKVASMTFIGTAILLLDSIIQAIYAGKLLGTNELTAVSSCFCILLVFVAICEGFVAGTVGQITEKYYNKDHEGLQNLVNVTWTIGIIVSIVMTLVGIVFGDTFLRILGTNRDVFDNASIYLRINLLFYGLIYVLFTCLKLLSSGGKKSRQFIYIIPTTVLNIIIIPLFCKGYGVFPKLGIKALAIVPLVTGMIGIIISLSFIYKKDRGLLMKPTGFSLKCDMKEIIVRGIPVFLPKIQAGVSYICILYFVNKFGGYASGAFYVISRIDALVCLPAIAVMTGIAAATSQTMMGGNIREMKNVIRWGLTIIAPSILILSILSIAMPEILVGIFTTDNNIIDMGTEYLRIAGLGYLFFIIMYVSNGILYGMKKNIYVIMISMIAIFLIRLPLFIAFTNSQCNIEVIWRIIIISYVISTFLSVLCNLRIRQKLKMKMKKLSTQNF